MNTKVILRNFIAQNFYVTDADKVLDADSLLAHGIIDSTGVLELVTFLESQFGFAIADTEIVASNLESIERIAAFVDSKSAGRLQVAAAAVPLQVAAAAGGSLQVVAAAASLPAAAAVAPLQVAGATGGSLPAAAVAAPQVVATAGPLPAA